MPAFDPVVLGLTLLGAGLVSTALLLFVLRIFPGWRPEARSPAELPLTVDIPAHQEAILIVESGGRLSFASPRARQWFGVGEEMPNLEQLARLTRPQGVFLGLCATEGHAGFTLEGRTVEGTSYRIPYHGDTALLISLRKPQLFVDVADASTAHPQALSDQTLSIFTELSQAMASSLDLESTLQAILESVERLLPADFSEISVWNTEKNALIPYRLVGIPDVDRHLAKFEPRPPAADGLTAYVVTNRTGLIVPDVASFTRIPNYIPTREHRFQSYLGLPLLIAGEVIGVIELTSMSKEAFSSNDLEVLRILSGQGAVALHNSLLFEEEQRRVLELSGLARLAESVSSLSEPQELFERLVDSLLPLLQVELLGFLLYDEDRRRLEGRLPFHGLLPDTIEWTYLPIEPDSNAGRFLITRQAIIANDAPNDPVLREFGLDHLALAAGIHQMVMMPLTSGGRMLGYLLVGDRMDGAPFEQNDIRLLAIVAGQAATIIENANLVQISRRRAQRAETLRRIASLTGSSATLDEILKYSLLDLARLLGAVYAAIFMLDENRGELRIHPASLFGLDREIVARSSRLPLEDPQFRFTVTGSGRTFFSEDLATDQRVISLYQPIIETLAIRSAIVAPLLVRDRGIGEIMLGHTQPNFFQRGEIQTVTTAAGQLAGAIEQESLYNQTDESLRRRVDQLTALTRISRELNTTLELNYLIERVYNEALRTTQADCGSLALFEIETTRLNLVSNPQEALPSRQAILRVGDEPTQAMDALEQIVLENEESLVIEDFELIGTSPYAASPVLTQEVAPVHEGIRSALVVPIAYQEQVAGIIHLHASSPGCFDQASREIAEALAVQAAIAIGNAHRYSEQLRRSEMLNQRVETLARLFETSQELQLDRPLEQSLENIAYAIQSATTFNMVLVSVFDAESTAFRRLAGAGISLPDMEELRSNPQSWESVQKVLQPEFRIGRTYFIPYEKMPVFPEDVHSLTVLPLADVLDDSDEDSAGQAWHPEDVLVVPLMDAQENPLGLISVDAPRDNRRPDRVMIETLEIFASQAALAIESQNKLADLRQRIEIMQSDVSRSQLAVETTREHLPTLLHKDLEQTIALQRISRQARRIRASMDIAEIVNRQGDRDAALAALGREFLLRMDVDAVLLAESGPRGPLLLHVLGAVPKEANPQALLGQRNPLLRCLESGEIELISRLDGTEWSQSPLLEALHAKGVLCLPVLDGIHVDVALMAISNKPLPIFSDEDELMLGLLTRQVAITLQNLNLLTETSRRLAEVNLLLDFSRQAGSLEPVSIMQTLANSALHVTPAAQACLVMMWDENRHRLVPQAAAGYRQQEPILAITYRPGESLPGKVFQEGLPQRIAELDFANQYSLEAEDLLRYRDATDSRLPVSSMVIPISIQTQARPLGIIVLDNYRTPDAFSPESQALITSLAQQTALNLDNTRLFRSAEQRAAQLKSLTDIAAVISSSLEPGELIDSLLDRLQSVLPYDTGTLWLRQGDQLVVRAARGFSDSDERVGLVAEIEDSLLMGEMVTTGQPILVSDVGADERFPSLLEPSYRSWLGAPLIASGEVIGVIALEKTEANYYTQEHGQVAATFASQAAVAFENASLYQQSLTRATQLDQRSQRLEILNRLSREYSKSLDPDHLLDFTLRELARTLHCSGVIGILFNADGAAMLQAESPPTATEYPIELPEAPLFERLRQSLGAFISEDVTTEQSLAPLQTYLDARSARSILALPLSTGADLHGLLIVHNEAPQRYSPEEVNLARTIANQAAIAVQNARLYAESRSLTEDLDQRVRARTAELANEHRRTETLLRIITELSASLDLDQVLNRTLKVLNEIVDAEVIIVLIARPGERELIEMASVHLVQADNGVDEATSEVQVRELATDVIRSRQAALIQDRGDQHAYRSAIAVPLLIGAEALGAIIFTHRRAEHFTGAQMDLIQAAANQVAVAVNNAELYRLIRDQAEDLGQMVRSQQVETQRTKEILEDVADGVLVSDEAMNITLFNDSAEMILDLARAEVLGKSLEHFTGLFGGAAQHWMDTIRTWSNNPGAYRRGDTYAEQITLENGRVVSVHLAPVSIRDTFLGTVSIFRDITHQVEVDRLKSEFVATVSHELRTPMTSIKGYVEILLMGAAGELNEQQTKFLKVVLENSQRLTILVNDLLDISRIEAGKTILSLGPLNMTEVAEPAIEDLKKRMVEDSKPMQVSVDIPARLPPANADIERVRQVMDNLLENAYYYTPEDGQITLRIRVVGDEIQVDVQDTGIGIPSEMQDRVFERFYRGENSFVLATPGTGLGLVVVKNIIAMHGGRIWLHSSGVYGEGSTFSFTLPVYTSNRS